MNNNHRPSESLLMIWMYKYLLGTLSSNKIDILKEVLELRHRQKKTRTALELKMHAAFIIDRPTRKYLGELLNDWEKRTGG